MRLLVVVLAILGIAAVACGGSSNGGSSGASSGGSSGGSGGVGGRSGLPFLPQRDGNNCVFAEELAEHDGDEVLLCAEVAAGEYLPEQKRNTVLYIGAPAPGHIASILLEGAIRSAFLTLPEERFGQPGTLVCAQGEISIVDGVPQVFVNNMQEIVFLKELVVSGKSCTGAGTN
ncbi:MAG TPA: hypothetical protein VFS30_06005 [Dehalococcoidia bacterium]|nr:hypothetical protein [Dehalococcoidia bacterium]